VEWGLRLSRERILELAQAHKRRIVSLGLEYTADAVEEWVGRLAQHDGALWIPVSAESATLAQRLMPLFPGIPTVEALYEYALERLAETTERGEAGGVALEREQAREREEVAEYLGEKGRTR